MTVTCVAAVPGCPACRTEVPRTGWAGPGGHVCDELCAMKADNRADPGAHARSHEPKRHACGAILDDRAGNHHEVVQICGWGTCVQYLCPGCAGFVYGFGPAGCACETDVCGHGTYAEQAPAITGPSWRHAFAPRH